MDAVEIGQTVRNARRAFERASTHRSLRDAMTHSGKLLTRYCSKLPDTSLGLRARQQITEAANRWLDEVEQEGKQQ